MSASGATSPASSAATAAPARARGEATPRTKGVVAGASFVDRDAGEPGQVRVGGPEVVDAPHPVPPAQGGLRHLPGVRGGDGEHRDQPGHLHPAQSSGEGRWPRPGQPGPGPTLRLQWRMPSLPLFPLGTALLPGARLPLQLFEPRYLVLARTLAELRGGRPALRRDPHPQGSRGRARVGAGPARHRVRGPRRRHGARRGSGRHRCAPRRHRRAALPPRRHPRRGRQHRSPPELRHLLHPAPAPTTRPSPTSRGGRCGSTPTYLVALGVEADQVEAPLSGVAYRIAERMVLDPADRQRVLEGADAATRLRTALAPLEARDGDRRSLSCRPRPTWAAPRSTDPAWPRPGRVRRRSGPPPAVGCRAWTSRTCRTSSSAPTARATASGGGAEHRRVAGRGGRRARAGGAQGRPRPARARVRRRAGVGRVAGQPGRRRPHRGRAAVRRGVPAVRVDAVRLPLRPRAVVGRVRLR